MLIPIGVAPTFLNNGSYPEWDRILEFLKSQGSDRLLGEDVEAGVCRSPADHLDVDFLVGLVEHIEIAVAPLLGRRDIGQTDRINLRNDGVWTEKVMTTSTSPLLRALI